MANHPGTHKSQSTDKANMGIGVGPGNATAPVAYLKSAKIGPRDVQGYRPGETPQPGKK